MRLSTFKLFSTIRKAWLLSEIPSFQEVVLVQQISCHKLTLDHEQNFNFSSFCRFDSTALRNSFPGPCWLLLETGVSSPWLRMLPGLKYSVYLSKLLPQNSIDFSIQHRLWSWNLVQWVIGISERENRKCQAGVWWMSSGRLTNARGNGFSGSLLC